MHCKPSIVSISSELVVSSHLPWEPFPTQEDIPTSEMDGKMKTCRLSVAKTRHHRLNTGGKWMCQLGTPQSFKSGSQVGNRGFGCKIGACLPNFNQTASNDQMADSGPNLARQPLLVSNVNEIQLTIEPSAGNCLVLALFYLVSKVNSTGFMTVCSVVVQVTSL